MKHVSAALLLAITPMFASANIIPTGAITTGVGPYQWTYDFQLSSDQDANSGLAPTSNPVDHTNLGFGAFLTIYDFQGYVPGSCAGPAGWTCTAQNVGFTPDDVGPIDLPGIVNLTWSYTSGPTRLGQPSGISLGTFRADSLFNVSTLVSYAARGINNTGFAAGTIADNVGNTQGPLATAIPEPATVALAGLALFAVASTRSLTTRRQSDPCDQRNALTGACA